MAGADTSKVRLQLEDVVVPENLINGNKFLKWDEDSSVATAVTLKVDPHGHFLHWKFQNKEGASSKLDVDCLELTQLRDTRTGRYANTPKDAKLRELCDFGTKDVTLENKTVTVVYGSDMVNLNFVNFCATSDKIAQEWCENLLKLAYHRSSQNPSLAKLLEKIYTKITIMVNRNGHIPVKNILKMFSSSTSDKKRVETALQVAGVHSGKDDTIDPKRFTFDVFFTFYLRLVNQKEVDKLFQELGAKNKPYLNTDHLVKFLNNEQRDPRLNEILYPFYDAKQAIDIIEKYEKNKQFARKGHMSIESLIKYLISDDNQVNGMESYLMAQDMEQPLSHYFIKSSHNTYLTGHQLTGRSSVEIYRQVLLSGCRCVELDCWDGKENTDPEPVITHGYTMCTDVLFKDVIEAINESAFKTSEFPVILSFENHCTQKQQAKMAHYCRTIFGDKLLIDPLSEFPIESGKPLPNPACLKNKILVKNKKRKQSDASKKRAGKGVKTIEETAETPEANGEAPTAKEGSPDGRNKVLKQEGKGSGKEPSSTSSASSKQPPKKEVSAPKEDDAPLSKLERKPSKSEVKRQDSQHSLRKRKFVRQEAQDGERPSSLRRRRKLNRQASQEKSLGEGETNVENGEGGTGGKLADGLDDVDEESDDSDDEEALSKEEALKKMQEKKDRGTAGQEAEAGAEMSALVNYIQPVHFSSFETSNKKNHSYEISSFVETSAMNRVKENPVEFVNYNKRQLSRIYPKGTRVDSSNFMPQIFWNVGCQLVALNYQQLDIPMQLNLGLFNKNGRTGYILKPDFMRRKERYFDPFAESTMDGIVAATVEVKVLSGQFLSDKRVGTYVEVDMFGLPADTVRKKYKTKTVTSNGINPQYDDDKFVFPKVIMPKLAMLRITAYDDNNNKQIGHKILPVDTLRPGYRHIPLRNELYQPLLMPSLFVHIKVCDYVPKGLANFADALVNPIQHQNQIEEEIKKRAEQLAVLMEETKSQEESAQPQTGDDAGPSTNGETTKEGEGETSSATPEGGQAAASSNPVAVEDKAPSNKAVEEMRTLEREKRDSIEALPPAVKKASRPSRQSETQLQILLNHLEPMVSAKDSGGSSGLLRSVSMGTAQFQSDAFSGFHNQSVRSRSTPNLVPQEEIIAATVDEIKQEKKYQKVLMRTEAELQKLIKKHEKKQSKLKKKLDKDEGKLKTSQDKSKRNLEKKNVATEKKAMKSKNVEEVKTNCAKAMEKLENNLEKEMLRKQVSHEDSLIDLYRKHLFLEKELRVEHAEMLFELQMDLMAAIHEKQLKKLDAQHKKVEQDLRKMLESKNIEEMKNIGKTKGGKQEINRLKREARKKHIDQAVTERTHLIQLQKKKKDELKETMKELQQNLSQEEFDMQNVIEEDYKQKCEQLIKDRKFKRLASDSNGSIVAMADADTPREVGQNGINGDMKKSSSGGLNGISDASPVSEADPATGPDSNGALSGQGLVTTKVNGTEQSGDGTGLVAGEVEVHASLDAGEQPSGSNQEEPNVNNSAQTTPAVESESVSNGSIVTGLSPPEPKDVCKDLETGECSKIPDSPLKATPTVELTRL
ncbi:1-phosphatidylinositol 4,5-bisphosphate phosphodiesterase beta-3-like [Diadema setosum]|uniref:1-phosphatidylinositol 4,5-bisphosphate phosphodiesterase beta-3-like n=1 Tax=Diadema setosum TaxID=31175 RepID=UPI003B3A9331